MLNLSGQVFIREEFLEKFKPLISFENINFKPWNIVGIRKHVITTGADARESQDIRNSQKQAYYRYTIECDGFTLDVQEYCLIGIDEIRDKKIQQIVE